MRDDAPNPKPKKQRRLKEKKTQRDHGLLRHYSRSELMSDNSKEYEVSAILLELPNLWYIYSSESPLPHKWGRKRKRSTSSSGSPKFPVISHEPVPVMKKSPPSMEMGSTSSSSCLTGEAKKTIHRTIKNGLKEKISNSQKISSDSNSVFQMETSLRSAQVGLEAQPFKVTYQNHMQYDEMTLVLQQARDNMERPRIDLNLPVAEEGNNHLITTVSFQNVTTRDQAAAQARQRRLGLIRSKKFSSRFNSSYQYK